MIYENSLSIQSSINVFGGTIDGERNTIIRDSYGILKTKLDAINKLIVIQEKSIVGNTENIKSLEICIVEINKVIDKLLRRIAGHENSVVENTENINELKIGITGINAVIPNLLSRVNTIEVYFKDRPFLSLRVKTRWRL